MTSFRISLFTFGPLLLFANSLPIFAQAALSPDPAPVVPGQVQTEPRPPDKRIFGVLPNYRTADETAIYTPISVQHKFVIALKDSFDYPLLGVAAVLAAGGQLTNSNPSFGQGWAGYGRRVGTGYADQVVANMMTEGILPSILREDPRYFRRGRGGMWSRTFYAASRVFVTKADSGATSFNYSEILGNAAGAAISNLYEPDGRNVQDNLEKWWMQVGVDAVSQVLKELWPDVKHKFLQRRNPSPATAGLVQ